MSIGKDPTKKSSLVLQVTTFIELYYEIYRNEHDEVFGRRKGSNLPLRPLSGEKDCVLSEVRHSILKSSGVSISPAIMDAVKSFVEYEASKRKPTPVFQRYARVGDIIYVDLGDDEGKVARISSTGWEVIGESPVLFQRNRLMKPLPVPDKEGNLALLSKYINIDDEFRPVLAAWMVAALIFDVDHPLLTLRGMAGSGKSVATGFLVEMLDPSHTSKISMPRSKSDWVANARNSYLLSFDNLSTITAEISDMLCVLVTGGSFSARKLYTDSSLHHFNARRVLIINGISLTGHGADLTDRMLPLELKTIESAVVKDATSLNSEWEQDLPVILGGLYNLAVKVFQSIDRVHPRESTRMAKFCEILACVDNVQQTQALETYLKLLRATAADEASGEPLLQAIEVAVTAKWSGTGKELLALFDSVSSKLSLDVISGLPKSVQALTSSIARNAPTLKKLGWQVLEHRPGGHDKVKRYELHPPRS